MFNLGFSELALIAIAALIFIRPNDLPKTARTLGRFVSKARYLSYLFSQQFEDFINDDEVTSKHRDSVKMLHNDDNTDDKKAD